MVSAPSPDAAASPRELLVARLLGEKPRSDAAVRVAVNRPPSVGEGTGSWHETAAPDVHAALAFLTRHEQEGDTYFSPAWVVGGKGAENVVGRRTLSVEVDWKSMPGATPEVRRGQAQNLLGTTPCPVISVGSGHGFHGHLLLPVGQRIEDYDDAADGRRHFEILGRAWRLFLEDKARELFGSPVQLDHCHGCERVWRPPGGWNTKVGEDARTLTSDRTRWEPVRLLHPGRPEGLAYVAEANLEFLIPFVAAAEAEQDEADARKNGKHRATRDATSDATPFDLELLPASIRQRWPLSDMNPSKADFLVAIELARAGHPEEVAEAAIRARRAAAGDGRGKAEREDYVERTVAKAFKEAGRTGSAPAGKPPPASRPVPRQPFPLAALPKVIRRYVEEGAACLQCCVSMVALPVLVVLAAAIGTTRRIRLRGGARPWLEPPVIWATLVNESGQMKSPALDLAIALIRRHEDEAARENEEIRRQYERDVAIYERDHARFKSGKLADPPEKPERRPYRRYLVSDVTAEALADRLSENRRGLLLYRDELSAWIQGFDAYRAGSRGGDAARWIELHGARTMSVDRKSGDRTTIHVRGAGVSVIGGIQPATLARVLTPDYFESGFAARLLLTMPPLAKREWTDAEVSDAALHDLERVLRRLLDLRFEIDAAGEPHPVAIPLTPEGKAAWIRFYNEHAEEGDGLHGKLAAAWSKGECYAARFALVLHLVREATGEAAANSGVGERDIAAGATLTRWFLGEADRVYAVLGESSDARGRRVLADWIRARGGKVTVRELARGPRTYRNKEAAAEQALQDLVAAGWGTWEEVPPSKKGGRPTRRFVLRDEPEGARDAAGADAKRTAKENEVEDQDTSTETQEYVFQGQRRERGAL